MSTSERNARPVPPAHADYFDRLARATDTRTSAGAMRDTGYTLAAALQLLTGKRGQR